MLDESRFKPLLDDSRFLDLTSVPARKAMLRRKLTDVATKDKRLTPDMLAKFMEKKDVPAIQGGNGGPAQAGQGKPLGQNQAPGAGGAAVRGNATSGNLAGVDAKSNKTASKEFEPEFSQRIG